MRGSLWAVQSPHTHIQTHTGLQDLRKLMTIALHSSQVEFMTIPTGPDNLCFLLFMWVSSMRKCLSLSVGTSHRKIKCRQLESKCTDGLLVLSIYLLGSRGAYSDFMSFVSIPCSSVKVVNPGLLGTVKVGLQPFPEKALTAEPPEDVQ